MVQSRMAHVTFTAGMAGLSLIGWIASAGGLPKWSYGISGQRATSMKTAKIHTQFGFHGSPTYDTTVLLCGSQRFSKLKRDSSAS
ncbi:hypothetical protein EDD16DRAFT_1625234 [Pisolithus croceorrhizus]|nr:hypothetical protein EDD16DRAFT_1625234 [Pisolithus croceorrhizus]